MDQGRGSPDLARPEWNPVYYSRADKAGIGFDRTASGSNAIRAVRARYSATAGGPGDDAGN